MAFLLALVIWLICIALTVPFVMKTWWMPDPITDHARAVDDQMALTFVVTGVIFILAHLALGYAVMKFGRKRAEAADYSTGNERWELLWTSAATVLFVGLTFMGYTVWAEARFADAQSQPGAADRVIVEVTGQQFVWNMRYAGADGKFGPLNVNFFIRELRLKLDTVPGIESRLRFKPDKVGTYEIACSELCGLGHYKMRSFMDVVEQADYDSWLQEQYSFLQ